MLRSACALSLSAVIATSAMAGLSNPVIPSSAAAGPIPGFTGNGLESDVWHYPVTNTSDAQAWAAANPADGSLLSTLVDYPNGAPDVVTSDVSLDDFLGIDGPSYSGSPNGALGEIFRFEGFIAIPAAGDYTFAVGSDDGFRLDIAGVEIASYPGDRSFSFSLGGATFESPGLYAVDLLYYSNLAGESGVEFYSTIPGGPDYGTPLDGGGIVPTSALYTVVPEPASVSLVSMSLLIRRNR